MKIYSMTATFGKLEHQTLTLKPGLNVIEAPNEWGKSTWCAFLVNMLYGLDTRAKSTKTALADKDRYAPWSGALMSGSIDLNWNGRDITIQRQTKGRLIFGEFSAFETDTGLPVPELNGVNCGQMLLGVERSVFTRAGFLKLTDLPVTQDDALRRRLNNLVTTGDESGTGDKLASTLRDLKNKCRYNRTGLLPQAEAQRQQLENQLSELASLQQDILRLRHLQSDKEAFLADLENHKAALQYAASLEDANRVKAAEAAQVAAQEIYDSLADSCDGLPSYEEAQQALDSGRALQQQLSDLQMEQRLLPPLPEMPVAPSCFQGLEPQDAVAQAKADHSAYVSLQDQRKGFNSRLWIGYAAAFLVSLGGLFLTPALYIASAVVLVASVFGIFAFVRKKNQGFDKEAQVITGKYPGLNPESWMAEAQSFAAKQSAYQWNLENATTLRGDADLRMAALQEKIRKYAAGDELEICLDRWSQIIAKQNALQMAQRDLEQAQKHAQALRSMLKAPAKPVVDDHLTYSEADTTSLLASTAFDLRQTQLKLGLYEGRAESLGQEALLRTQLKNVTRRIHQLEDTYSALELALNALSAATTELQRRFAPRISKRAQELFGQLTGQRYDRLALSSDLSLNAGAENEDTLRPAQYRSDGTVDQLYLALRLAVAEELTPDAPLVLDDALVRFDDTRLAAAMDILRTLGEDKQVILFTCQGRESRL
ncbi:MAG: hypothetical protein E7439_03595 [Ruminococcaceae bacterium]|nr:hypothetical protein [Oscillospiraceae bacterium]